MAGVAYYRVSDPLENFKLRITVREIPRVDPTGEEKSALPNPIEVDLSWQEKIPGPSEMVANLASNKKAASDGEIEAINNPMTSPKKGVAANINDLRPVMLYTYVDKDHFQPKDLPPVLDTPFALDAYVGAAINTNLAVSDTSGLSPNDALDEGDGSRVGKVQRRFLREDPYKAMFICLATDVDVSSLKERQPTDISLYRIEHVVCALKLHQDGLLEVSPSFSDPVEEGGQMSNLLTGTHSKRVALSAFMEDKTVSNAFRKGFKLSTLRILSKAGLEYEICIQNLNEALIPQQIDEVRRLQQIADKKAAIISRGIQEQQQQEQNNNRGGSGSSSSSSSQWKQDPPSRGYDKSVATYVEIVSATNFIGERVFVNYEISVPQGWDLRTGNLSDGAGEKDLTVAVASGTAAQVLGNYSESNGNGYGENNADGMASAAELLALDGYADGEDSRGALAGTTHTAIAREARFSAFGSYAFITRPRYSLPFVAYACGSGSRLFSGTLFFVITVISLALGVEYPFWLVPALVFLYTVGTGYPGGGPTQAVFIEDGNTVNNVKSGKGRPSTGQWSTSGKGGGGAGKRRAVGDVMSAPVAVFNHMMNLSFDVKNASSFGQVLYPAPPPSSGTNPSSSSSSSSSSASSSPFGATPTIHFEVYSMGWMDRCILEGYGYLPFPGEDSLGFHEFEVKTWRPVGDLQAKMREQFLGSAARLRDRRFVDIPDQDGAAVNKFGMLTESTGGSLRIRIHSIMTDPKAKELFHARRAETMVAPQAAIRRTVDDILQNFKAAGRIQRATLNRSTGLGLGLGLGSSVASSMGLGRSSTAADIAGRLLTSSSMTSYRSSAVGSINASASASASSTAGIAAASQDKGDRVAQILARARLVAGKGAAAAAKGAAGNGVAAAGISAVGAGAGESKKPDKTRTSAGSASGSGRAVANRSSSSSSGAGGVGGSSSSTGTGSGDHTRLGKLKEEHEDDESAGTGVGGDGNIELKPLRGGGARGGGGETSGSGKGERKGGRAAAGGGAAGGGGSSGVAKPHRYNGGEEGDEQRDYDENDNLLG